MNNEILNLDALKAPSKKIQFLGKQYELGYIPSGAAIPLIESYNALLKKQTDAAGGTDLDASLRYAESHAQEVMEDTIDFVFRFCSFFYQDIKRDDIVHEATKAMVETFFMEIITAIVKNAGMQSSGAEAEGDKKKALTGTSS